MTFRENINRICKERGTTLSAVTRSIGLSSSKVTAWNNGSLPKEGVMLELAHALECSVMDFFADEKDLSPKPVNEAAIRPAHPVQPGNEDEEDLLRIYRFLPRRARHEFMTMAYEFENRKELEGDNKSAVS